MVRKNNWSASGFGKIVSPDLVKDEFLDVEVIIMLQGTNMFGDDVYAYLQIVGRNLKEMFGKMQKGENFKPADYGAVLAAGRGEPPPEVREEMMNTYHMLDVPLPRSLNRPVFTQPKFFDEEE